MNLGPLPLLIGALFIHLTGNLLFIGGIKRSDNIAGPIEVSGYLNLFGTICLILWILVGLLVK